MKDEQVIGFKVMITGGSYDFITYAQEEVLEREMEAFLTTGTDRLIKLETLDGGVWKIPASNVMDWVESTPEIRSKGKFISKLLDSEEPPDWQSSDT